MLHIGSTDVTVAVPDAKRFYVGSNFIGLAKPDKKESSPSLQLYDRVNNKATVAGFFTDSNGQKYAVCVADAAYRSIQLWSNLEEVDTPLPNYATESDALTSTESATFNMNIIKNNYALSTHPVFNFAYSKTLEFNGVTYNGLLPNASELQMIYNNRVDLDSLDTTLNEYPNNSLASWKIENNSSSCWSSTEKNASSAWRLTYKGVWAAGYAEKNFSTNGVIPIFEIPVND